MNQKPSVPTAFLPLSKLGILCAFFIHKIIDFMIQAAYTCVCFVEVMEGQQVLEEALPVTIGEIHQGRCGSGKKVCRTYIGT